MKYLIFTILALWGMPLFAQNAPPTFERLKAYSEKSDDYHVGFFFTKDTVLLSYPNAMCGGDEKQISADHSPVNTDNHYQSYHTFEHFGEMGFVDKTKFLIFHDSVNRLFTNISCVFNLTKQRWDTAVFYLHNMNADWKISRTSSATKINDTFKTVPFRFYFYDTEGRLIKDSLAKAIANTLVPDQVRYYGYDAQNHVTFDSIAKYVNNIGAREYANYYTFQDTFLTERRFMAKSGTIQVWQFSSDNAMRREISFLSTPAYQPIYDHLEYLDPHGNVTEYIWVNFSGNTDTATHYRREYVYDDKGNMTTSIEKIKDMNGIWLNTEKIESAYNANRQLIEKSIYYYIRPTNSWRKYVRYTYEFNERMQMTEMKYDNSKDSVNWNNKTLLKYTYTAYGHPSQVKSYSWDTLTNEYALLHTLNYYWEKYFYDDNIIESSDDFSTAIYPNPSDNIFNVIFSSETVGDGEVSIFNALGESVLKKRIPVVPQMNHFTWDASGLPVGLYMMVLQAEGKEKTFKLLKSR